MLQEAIKPCLVTTALARSSLALPYRILGLDSAWHCSDVIVEATPKNLPVRTVTHDQIHLLEKRKKDFPKFYEELLP